MAVSGISGSASLSTTAGLEAMVQQLMSLERQPLTRLQTQKSDLEVKKSIYNDIKTKLEALRSASEALTGDSGTLNKFSASLSDDDVLGVSIGDSSILRSAKYNITVNTLAQAHSIASVQQSDSTSDINLSGDLILNGQTISIDTSDSLNDIRDKINAVDFEGAEVEAVVATIVDNKLVLTSANTGSDAAISFTDNTNGGDGLGLAQVQAAANASLTVNGVNITRQSNTDLDDIINGLTFDLKEAGTTQITVAKDDDETVDKVKAFLKTLNELTNHLKLKTQPQLDLTATGDNPTYKSAPLGRDLSLRSLRFDFTSDLLSFYEDAEDGAPISLADIGITIGSDNVSFELADDSDLQSALDQDFEGVASLLNHVLGNVEDRIDLYVDGNNAFITNSKSGIEDQIELLDNRIESFESRLASREEATRKQLYELQSQLFTMQYQFQSTQAAMSGSINILNQLG